MDRYDPDRPSIFSKPDADSAPEPTRTPEPRPYGEDPTVVTTASRPTEPPRSPRHEYETGNRVQRGEPVSRQVIVLGSMGIAILALGGFIAASMLRPASEPRLVLASAAPSTSVSSAVPSGASLEPTASAEPTAEPTPQPTPAGPPQEIAQGGWATVTVGELNVRTSPGLDQPSVYLSSKGPWSMCRRARA